MLQNKKRQGCGRLAGEEMKVYQQVILIFFIIIVGAIVYAGDVVEVDHITGKIIRSICPLNGIPEGPWELATVFPGASLDMFELYSCGIDLDEDGVFDVVLIYAWDIREKTKELIKTFTITEFNRVLELENRK